MNLKNICVVTFTITCIAACGGGGSSPQPTVEPTVEPTAPGAEPTQEPQGPWTCPSDGSLYFCDDFEDGTYADRWDDKISTYGLSDPGVFDVLDEGDAGKSLRFTAGTRGELDEGELILVKAEQFSGINSDYFVEYKIRPRQNGNTGNKYLYSMVRYQDYLEWYFGGLNMQSSAASTQVEVGTATKSGGISRESQVKQPLLLGSKDATDGSWYTVRVDVVGNTLTSYLNGEQQGTWTDDASLYNSAGLIGFFTFNRSFELDYVKVGDPAIKPVQLQLDYGDSAWLTAADGDPLLVNVTALQSDGTTADAFSVVSSDDGVVAVSADGNVVTLQPQAAGTAEITFTAASDASVQRVISAEIEPAWIMPTTDYSNISSLLSPSSTDEYIDTTLRITFDSAPSLGTTGEVRIFDGDSDEIVDRIKVQGETEELGFAGQENVRVVNTALIRVEGNDLVIKPHSQALSYGKKYYVAIGPNVAMGAQLNGVDFNGLGKNASWSFSTKASGPASNSSSLTVDDDGSSADFLTLQGALDWVMENADKDAAFTINLQNGSYNELLFLRGKNNLSIVGESRDGAVIAAKNNDGMNGGSGKSASPGSAPGGGRGLLLVESVDMLSLESLTIKNTHTRTGSGDQAETIYFNSNNRLVARDAAFISEQDTLLLKGYNWFYDCLVAGNVDFIWGYSVASVFESSEIRSLGDSKSGEATSKGGYLLQARTQNATDPGFVFLNSRLTHADGPTGVTIETGTTHLARSGGSSSYYDNVTFINTAMDDHVADVGWAYFGINGQPATNPEIATADQGWREFGSTDLAGNALDLSERCGDSDSCHILTEAEVSDRFCSRAQIFASYNNGAGWDPYPGDSSDDDCDGPVAETWAGKATQLGATSTSIDGSIAEQSDSSVTFSASGGKFESQKTSLYVVSQDVTGDFTFTAKVKAVGTLRESNSYQFPAGLIMCECDTSNVTRNGLLANVSVNDITEDSTEQLVATYGHVLSATDSWAKTGSDAVSAGDNLYLKLVRQGQDYSASYSMDGGSSYTDLGSGTFTGLPEALKVGVFAAPNGSGEQSFTFEDMAITQ